MNDREELPARLVLKGTFGLSMKNAAWFGLWGGMYFWIPWELYVVFGFGMFVTSFGVVVPNSVHAVVCVLAFLAGVALVVSGDSPQAHLVAVLGFCAAAAACFLPPATGGAKLTLEADGVTVVDWWCARKLFWDRTVVRLNTDGAGKPHIITLSVELPTSTNPGKRQIQKAKDLHLPDHYGMATPDLAALMNRFRDRALSEFGASTSMRGIVS